jgi:LAO/AO transport system kinase
MERFLKRDERALARAISLVEAGTAEGQALLTTLRSQQSKAHIIGITGSPGSGKSTLLDQLIGLARAAHKRVAVLAVDPSSPFSGGAILGDRIRMTRWHQDSDVFIRSMATRGHLGGLAAPTLQVIALLNAYGFDYVFVETVGVGQSEVDIVQVADTTLLVLTPAQGDGVQAFKAGIMEIADIFVVNKADLPGSARLKREIEAALGLGHSQKDGWPIPVQEGIATTGEGMAELFEQVGAHYRYLEQTGKLASLKRRRERFEISALLSEELRLALQRKEDAFIEAILQGKMGIREAVKALLQA